MYPTRRLRYASRYVSPINPKFIERQGQRTKLGKSGERYAADEKVVPCQDLHSPCEEHLRKRGNNGLRKRFSQRGRG